jgi:hypothetical protein
MKLSTDIKPRADGKVVATAGGAAYVFVRDAESGQLTCDVSNEAHVAYLLDTGNFYPADLGDIPAGLAAVAMHADAVDGDLAVGAVLPSTESPQQSKAGGGKRKAG